MTPTPHDRHIIDNVNQTINTASVNSFILMRTIGLFGNTESNPDCERITLKLLFRLSMFLDRMDPESLSVNVHFFVHFIQYKY